MKIRIQPSKKNIRSFAAGAPNSSFSNPFFPDIFSVKKRPDESSQKINPAHILCPCLPQGENQMCTCFRKANLTTDVVKLCH